MSSLALIYPHMHVPLPKLQPRLQLVRRASFMPISSACASSTREVGAKIDVNGLDVLKVVAIVSEARQAKSTSVMRLIGIALLLLT